MKKADFNEIKNLTKAQLLIKAREIRKDLSDLKLKKDVKDVRNGSKKRKDLARVLTVLQQKNLLESLTKEITK